MIVGSYDSTITNEVPPFSAWFSQVQRTARKRTSEHSWPLNVRIDRMPVETTLAQRRARYDSRGRNTLGRALKMGQAWNSHRGLWLHAPVGLDSAADFGFVSASGGIIAQIG